MKGGDDPRIEGHQCHRPGIALQRLGHRDMQRHGLPALPVRLILDLDQQRHPARDKIQKLRQSRHRFRAAQQRHLPQRGGIQPVHTSLAPGQAMQVIVVKHHRHPVRGWLDIQFDPIARINGRLRGGKAVFRDARPMQPAMGDGQGQKLLRQGHQAISNTASISTETPSGSDGAETAARAWRPASPNT